MNTKHRAAVMYLIAAVMFLIAGVVGFLDESRANVVFIVLSVAFVILALNAWPSSDGSNND